MAQFSSPRVALESRLPLHIRFLASTARCLPRFPELIFALTLLDTTLPASSSSDSLSDPYVMVHYSDLTTGGILYEGGDFPEWRTRIEAILRHHLKHSSFHRYGKQWLSESTAARINALVSDDLLKRVPCKIRVRPLALIDHLENLAKPFRLMDLPPELRLRIFENSMDEELDFFDVYALHGDHPRSQYPSLLHVSSLVRREALPIFYTTRTFGIEMCYISDIIDQYSPSSVLRKLKLWAHTVVDRQLGHLRRLNLFFERDPCDTSFTLHFSEEKGLHLQEDGDDLSAEFREKLQKVVNATESHRKALGYKGEALVLAATCQPELWEDESLEF